MAKSACLPASLEEAWELSAINLVADTPRCHVFRGRQGDKSVVVKCLKPEGHGERVGMDFLRWRDGHGAVRLLARIGDSCLLEDAGAVTLREYLQIHGDEAATAIVLNVVSRLHAPSGEASPATLLPLAQHFRPPFELASTASQPDIADLAGWAAQEVINLLAHQRDATPLHGDLHHDNIIGNGEGWLAIDPQGLVGDPVYDVANIFGNPVGGAEIILDPVRITRLAKTFAMHFGCEPAKVLRYAAAHAMLSAAWTLESMVTPSGEENLHERLAFAGIARSLLVGPLPA